MSATSSASSEYIPDPPGGFCILVANGGVANWVSLSGDGLLRINGTNISVLNKSTSSELLNGELGWTGTEVCP